MRHGAASLEASSDLARPLVKYGYNTSMYMASFLKEKSFKIERVLVSPYLRAQQTLSAVREVLTLSEENIDIIHDLKPYGNVDVIMYFLRKLAKTGISSIILISHLPLICYLISELCPEYNLPVLSTSAITCISCFNNKKNVLEWHINPIYK